MKQQILIAFKVDGKFVKDLDPRAMQFKPYHRPVIDGKRSKLLMDYDWCDPNDQAHLNMANSADEFKITSALCFKGL